MIRAQRLVLRTWRESDLESFAKLNADPIVMKYFPSPLSRKESDESAAKISHLLAQNGWGFWAVEIPDECGFIGFIGLNTVTFQAPFTPAVEVGWRLAAPFWNKGYATEGAKAAIEYGFEKLHLDKIVSFTVPMNLSSRRVMEKIGMNHDPKDDFGHPRVPPENPLHWHVLYRIRRDQWRRG